MGLIQDLFELVRDNSFELVEEEAEKEVAVALAGNSLEVRDKLHRALSTRLESLWTANPFRLVETNERPTIDAEDQSGGLILYALYEGDRIPGEKKSWLQDLVSTPNVKAIVAVLPHQKDEPFEQERRLGRRLQGINPLRLIGGKEVSGASADGSAFNDSASFLTTEQPTWETDLQNFVQGSDQLSMVKLSGLQLSSLQRELLPQIVSKLPGRELALARRAPIFRTTVSSHFVARTARSNAELVLMANATANIPFLAGIFGGGADFVLLSKNQFELSHRLAAIYGQKRSSRVEVLLELAPIVGAAFLWRSLARTATRKLPFLLAILPKAAIAYGSTFVVGKIAEYYYANGRTSPAEIADLLRGAFDRFFGRKAGDGPDEGGSGQQRLRRV